MATKKKATAQRSAKTEALSIRIDPRLRYGLELLARQQRRSVTGVVEWAIDQALRNETVTDSGTSFDQLVKDLWSPNEVERLVNLARTFPDLMTYDEARMWAVLKDSPDLLKMNHRGTAVLDIACLEDWEKLRPLLVSASERQVVKGLTAKELDNAGIVTIPF